MRRITNIRLPRRCAGTKTPAERWWALVDDDGCLQALTPMGVGTSVAGDNWQGDWLSPMGVDLQINGGLGLAFPELQHRDLPQLLALLDRLWEDGVEAISPTLVTCGIAPLRQALAVLNTARAAAQPRRCRLLGAHLEGPFLADARRGAHPREHLCRPSLEALHARINGYEHTIALVTLAPELEGAAAVIDRLHALGITVALGHSDANAEQASQAFAAGVGMITHAFNAMPGLHHRAPGPLAEACRRGGVALGLIADGVHVHPTMAVLLHQLAGDQLVLVSDALAPYGLADGQHRWDERVLLVEKGTCRLADGTLAGVTLPQLEGACRLAAWGHNPEASIWAATMAPRAVITAGIPLDAADQMLGCSLDALLRWHWDPTENQLHWQHAA
ncbi:MAG: N-acetylglucosamine-6-phosphate deacetylase [Synechococcus sp.]